MGKLSFCFPLMICWAGLLTAFSARNRVRASTLFLIAGIVLWIVSILQVAQFRRILGIMQAIGVESSWSEFIRRSFIISSESTFGGGALGAVLAYLLANNIAVWGASILLVFLLLTNLLMLFRVPIPAIGQRVWRWTAQRSTGAFEALRLSFMDWKEERAYQRSLGDEDDAEGSNDAYDSEESAQSSAIPKAPRPPRLIPVAAEISPEPPRSNVLYMEDIVPSEEPQAKPAKKRGRGDVPAYLQEQSKTYEALDVLPENAPESPEIVEADEIPWETMPAANQPAGSGRGTGISGAAEREAPAQAGVGHSTTSFGAAGRSSALEDKTAAPLDLDPPAFARASQRRAPQPAPPSSADASASNLPPWADERMPRRDDDDRSFVRYPSSDSKEEYRYPPFQLLNQASRENRADTREIDLRNTRKLEETLQSFKITAKVVQVTHGPAITRYELQPGPGVKVASIVSLTDDIALNMAAQGVRIEAPIPGKSAIGIEIPNDNVLTVPLRDVLESDEAQNHPSRLAVALGKDIAGRRIIANLVSMPHLLIAGATGSGKSVCINTIITSIIYRSSPAEVRMILVDPKVVELSVYNGIPHLEAPVVTNPKEAAKALKWAVMEMEERYRKFASREVRDIRGYNARRADGEPLMPQIVVVIDELADLMLVASNDVEESICRLAQLARAAGIHLVIATQRPSVNVITGVIKSNIPSRIAFAVASQVDARTILDNSGAEKLIGRGDMLYAPQGGGKPLRVQGCYISDQEVARIVDYVKQRHDPEYKPEVISYIENEADDAPFDEDFNDADIDELLRQAAEMSVESGQASISMLQRRLRVGYARAGRLIDEMARRSIVGQAEGVKPRQVLVTMDELDKLLPLKSSVGSRVESTTAF
jgi:DNA segregation ATPase FtsK/SpoIIIE-like protein